MKDYVKGKTYYLKVLDARDYVSRYRDAAYFEQLCTTCPNYGRRWGCPPFAPDEYNHLDSYDKVGIMLIKIDLLPDTPGDNDTLRSIIDRFRPDGERRLLMAERAKNGLAALFTGMCPHCPGEQCARISGEPCRHPDLVRPSLEALGFNLERTASEIHGIDIRWCHDGHAPEYLTLIGGIFYNTWSITEDFDLN